MAKAINISVTSYEGSTFTVVPVLVNDSEGCHLAGFIPGYHEGHFLPLKRVLKGKEHSWEITRGSPVGPVLGVTEMDHLISGKDMWREDGCYEASVQPFMDLDILKSFVEEREERENKIAEFRATVPTWMLSLAHSWCEGRR